MKDNKIERFGQLECKKKKNWGERKKGTKKTIQNTKKKKKNTDCCDTREKKIVKLKKKW